MLIVLKSYLTIYIYLKEILFSFRGSQFFILTCALYSAEITKTREAVSFPTDEQRMHESGAVQRGNENLFCNTWLKALRLTKMHTLALNSRVEDSVYQGFGVQLKDKDRYKRKPLLLT